MPKRKRNNTNNLTIFKFTKNKFLVFVISVAVSIAVYFIERPMWYSSNSNYAVINTCFSSFQENGCKNLIIEAILNSRKSIKIMAYSFTSKEIFESLKEKSREGLDIKIILDKSQESSPNSLYKEILRFPNIKVKIDHKTQGIFHHKVILIDDDIVIEGSYNFTNSAEFRNAENANLIKDKLILNRYLQEFKLYWDSNI